MNALVEGEVEAPLADAAEGSEVVPEAEPEALDRVGVDLADATASPSWLDRAATVRGLTLVGAFDAARSRSRAFVPSEEIDCEPVNDRTTRRARTELLINAARVAMRGGSHAEARAFLAEARGVWEGGATPEPYQETPLRLARARWAAGEWDQALRALASLDADVPAALAGSDVLGWWVASLAEAFIGVGESAEGLRLGQALARSLRAWTYGDPGVGRGPSATGGRVVPARADAGGARARGARPRRAGGGSPRAHGVARGPYPSRCCRRRGSKARHQPHRTTPATPRAVPRESSEHPACDASVGRRVKFSSRTTTGCPIRFAGRTGRRRSCASLRRGKDVCCAGTQGPNGPCRP